MPYFMIKTYTKEACKKVHASTKHIGFMLLATALCLGLHGHLMRCAQISGAALEWLTTGDLLKSLQAAEIKPPNANRFVAEAQSKLSLGKGMAGA